MPISAADLLIYWYRERGIDAEVLEPGPDDASAYLKLSFKVGQSRNVAAAIYDGGAGRGFLRWLSFLLSDAKERDLKLSAIHLWVRPEEVESIGKFIEEEIKKSPKYKQIFGRIHLRSLSSLSVRGEVVGQLLSLDRGVIISPPETSVRTGRTSEIRDMNVGRGRGIGSSVEVGPRSIRSVREEKIGEIALKEKLEALEKRVNLLEIIVKLLAERRREPSRSLEWPIPSRRFTDVVTDVETKTPNREPVGSRVREEPPRVEREPYVGTGETPGSRDGVSSPPEGAISFELIEEFARDNPWAQVLSEKGGENED